MKRLTLAAFAALLVVALAGCGGSTVYTLDRSKTCLTQRSVPIGGPLSFVASTATGGAFRANLKGNFVQVAFGDTVKSGVDIENAYQRFALPNVRAGLPDVLKRYNNAVTLWHAHPSDSDLALIVGCLR
ncbi:MAG TPA: hypothetical protein VH063_17155 [Gaiellaceae bacterium]|jgi:hypothetical protein|nr:hypothetical protein [Gaiellaceae bacterium]